MKGKYENCPGANQDNAPLAFRTLMNPNESKNNTLMSSHFRDLDWQIVQEKLFSSSTQATTFGFSELELIAHCNPVMDCNTFPEERKTLLSCNQGDLISTVVAQAGARGERQSPKCCRFFPKLTAAATARI